MSEKRDDMLAAQLRQLRRKKGVPLRMVGAATDIDPALLSKIETGERLPTVQQIKRLAAFHEVSERTLLATRTATDIVNRYGRAPELQKALRVVKAYLKGAAG